MSRGAPNVKGNTNSNSRVNTFMHSLNIFIHLSMYNCRFKYRVNIIDNFRTRIHDRTTLLKDIKVVGNLSQ